MALTFGRFWRRRIPSLESSRPPCNLINVSNFSASKEALVLVLVLVGADTDDVGADFVSCAGDRIWKNKSLNI